jgi:hypothetical protein
MRRLAPIIALVVVLLAVGLADSSVARGAANEPEARPPAVATPEPPLDPMTAGGVALIRAAQSMETAAAVLEERATATGDPTLADLAQHWRNDAEALRARGVRLLFSATADSMVHDPARAHELNLENLRANGEMMAVDGKTMIEHGKEMSQQVATLLAAGVLSSDLAAQLTAAADELVATGEQLEREGTAMRDDAETMLRSIGEQP